VDLPVFRYIVVEMLKDAMRLLIDALRVYSPAPGRAIF
jgi:hypothetical protein